MKHLVWTCLFAMLLASVFVPVSRAGDYEGPIFDDPPEEKDEEKPKDSAEKPAEGDADDPAGEAEDDPPGKGDKDDAADKPEGKKGEEDKDGLKGFYAGIAGQVELTEAQTDRMLEIQKEEDEAVAEWDEKNAEKVERAEDKISRIENDRQRERYEKELEAFKQQRDKLQARYRTEALELLDSEQHQSYFAPMIRKTLDEEMGDIELSEEQQTQVDEICGKMARRVKPDPNIHKSDKLKNAAMRTIYRNVLTGEQKKEYAQLVKEREKQKRQREKEKQRGREDDDS